jgi:predicted Zn-dependent protease
MLATGCAPSEGRPKAPITVPMPPLGRTVYLAPIGDFPASDAQALVSHYLEKFRINVVVLPSIAVPNGAFDSDRQQVIAEQMIDGLRRGHGVAADPNAVVIGLTTEDTYIASSTGTYTYGLRQDHLAVVSTAHFDDGFIHGDPMRRLQKVVTKDIGILFYGLPLSDDPGSVLYRDVGGPGDLDRMSEDF